MIHHLFWSYRFRGTRNYDLHLNSSNITVWRNSWISNQILTHAAAASFARWLSRADLQQSSAQQLCFCSMKQKVLLLLKDVSEPMKIRGRFMKNSIPLRGLQCGWDGLQFPATNWLEHFSSKKRLTVSDIWPCSEITLFHSFLLLLCPSTPSGSCKMAPDRTLRMFHGPLHNPYWNPSDTFYGDTYGKRFFRNIPIVW